MEISAVSSSYPSRARKSPKRLGTWWPFPPFFYLKRGDGIDLQNGLFCGYYLAADTRSTVVSAAYLVRYAG